ncbi:Choline/carnitine o-acyltransferase [Globisporangium polare]
MRVVQPLALRLSTAAAKKTVAIGSQRASFATQTALPGWFKRMQTTNEFNLPRLPVPQLGDTIERYLETIRPLVDAKEWQAHADLAAKFEKEEGRKLQEHLLKRELKQAMGKAYPFSYIEADWDKMYLGGRYESPINVNPAYGIVDETEGNLKGMIPRTAAFVRSAAKWWEKVKSSELEQDKNQCMFSFARQFGTAKIPQLERDVLVSTPRSSHIVVLKGTQFFKLNVLSPDGKKLLSQAALEKRLDEIMNSSEKAAHDDLDISTLSAESRDEWARIRDELIAFDAVNEQSLNAIDSALFVLVLEARTSADTKDRMELALHGKGSGRWFDKVQVAVQPDGHLTVNFEHSFSDGTSWNRWLHEVWHDMRGTNSGFSPLKELPEFVDEAKPAKLNWKLSNNLVEDVKKAEANFAKFAGNLNTEFLSYNNFAKNECKQWKLSPDGVAQMALQLAFVRAHGKVAATYESCSTRNFLHGRTETIRSLTPAAAEFARAVAGGNASTETQRELFVTAVSRHVEMAKMAQKGLGVDRHLTALTSIAGENGIQSEFLKSPVRAASTNFQISSSNVTTPFLQYFNFGAVVPDGYGVGYLLHSDVINVSLTNFNDSSVADGKKYKQAIKDSLDTIKALADSTPAP